MPKDTHPQSEIIAEFWSRLTDTRIGMLWLPDSGQHPQPMTHYVDEDNEALWFITSSDTDLYQALGQGAEARFAYQSEKGDYQASVFGPMMNVKDDAKLDELWSVPVSAWFEGGRDDPKVRLLRVSVREAAIWSSDSNSILVGLKMLNAAMQDGKKMPDVGDHHVINFAV